MKDNNILKTPVLFLIFNRLESAKQVFEAIKKARPSKLYIAADGFRDSCEGEDKKVKAVRNYVLNNIDWNCEVKKLFREKNLGCKYAVSGAIDWFFENEEMGIILEDDCLPSQSFFWFCEELLLRYKNDNRVYHISGSNFQNGKKRGEADYYFSKYNHIWGWATWSDRWKKYDVEITDFHDFKIHNILKEKKEQIFWHNIFARLYKKEIDTWDYQYQYMLLKNHGLSIIPNVNLIMNIGFGTDATHTKGESILANKKNYELELSNHPKSITQNVKADKFTFKTVFKPPRFTPARIIAKMKQLILKK